MSEVQPVIIVDEDEISRAALARLAAQLPDLAGALRFCGPETLAENPDPEDLIVLTGPGDLPQGVLPEAVLRKPVRPGAVFDRARAIAVRRQRRAQAQFLRIGPYTLDPVQNVLQGPEPAVPIRLTDKEKDILALLHARGGEPIGREELLERVWGYGQDIETHTLETHIYRLRQKIEADPARPVLLLTDGRGYFLSVENQVLEL